MIAHSLRASIRGLAVAAHTTSLFASCAAMLCGTFILVRARAQDGSAATAPYLNPALSPDARARDLVARMTLEEKASQLVNQSRAVPRLKVPAYDWWSESLHGVAVNGTTEFPEPIGLAATFVASAIHTMATDIALKAESYTRWGCMMAVRQFFHGLDFWAPNVNIFRDPRWGRGQ